MGRGRLVFEADAEILADGVATELDDGLAGLIDRAGEQRGDLLRRLCSRGFEGLGEAVHHR